MVATGFTSGDTRKVDVAGDTMTGDLVLSDSSPDTALSAASRGYVDGVAGAAGMIPLTQKGAPGGVATLDGAALLPHAQVPPLAGADITSGTVAAARLPVGTAAGTVAAGNDPRLGDARTPTAHKTSHQTGGTDAITPAMIGAEIAGAAAAEAVLARAAEALIVPRWQPATAYALNQQVVSPNNDVVKATVAHTSSAAYATDLAKWGVSSTYAPLGAETWVVANMVGASNDAKIQAAFALWAASPGGGTIILPSGAVTCTSQWATAYTAGGPKFLRITAGGFSANGAWGDPSAVTTVDHTYNGAGAAKLQFEHIGSLVMDGFLMKDTSGSSKPFVLITNCTPFIDGNLGFQGSKTSAWDQDVFKLGGTSVVVGAGADAPFQGYGGFIRGVWCDKIRRGFHLRTFCNSLEISGNTAAVRCGADASAAFIDIVGSAESQCVGNDIDGNTIEAAGYVYPIAAEWALGNSITKNNCFDPLVTTLACVYMRSVNAAGNIIICGYGDLTGSTPYVLEAVPGINTIIGGPIQGGSQFCATLLAQGGVTTNGRNGAVAELILGTAATDPQVWVIAGTTPEGVITAPAGSLVIVRNGGQFRKLWFKSGGTGNTGWLPINTGFINAQSVGAANLTLNVAFGNIQAVTLTASQGGNTTAFSNGVAGDIVTVEFIQSGAGSFTYSWPTNCRFAGASAPTPSTTSGRRDIVTFRFDGTNWLELSRSIGVGS